MIGDLPRFKEMEKMLFQQQQIPGPGHYQPHMIKDLKKSQVDSSKGFQQIAK